MKNKILKNKNKTLEQKRDFYNMLSFYQNSNLDILTSLALVSKDVKGMEIKNIEDSLKNGKKLQKIFEENGLADEFISTIIDIGEHTEGLKKSFEIAFNYFDEKIKSRKVIEKISIYPLILILSIFFLIIFMITFAIPKLYAVYLNMEASVPIFMSTVMEINRFIMQNQITIKMILLLFVLILAIFPFSKKIKKWCIEIFLSIEPIRKINTFRTLRQISWQLATLLASGIEITRAIDIIGKSTKNSYIKEILAEIILKLRNGQNLSSAVSDYKLIFNETAVAYISVGEKTGSLIENLNYIHKYCSKKLADTMELLSRASQPIIIIIIGLLLGTLLMLVLPLLDVTNLYSGI